MKRNLIAGLTSLIVPILFTSCQWMPEEEVLPASPILHSYEAEEYEYATVMRGDLIMDTTVNCTYIPAKEEGLSFALGSVYIDKIYVDEGDSVKAGQLLAELEQENLQEQIADEAFKLRVLQVKKEHIRENLELDLKKYDIVLKDLEWELEHTEGVHAGTLSDQKALQEEKRAETAESYEESLQDMEDSIYLQKIRLEEAQAKLKERQIFAGIDGTITYCRGVREGQRSVKGQRMFTVSDLDTTVFKVEGEEAQYFTSGMECVLTCNKKEYSAYVIDAAEFGLESDAEIAYLKLKQPDPSLEDGTRGKVVIILEQRNNVLYLQEDAVKKANGQEFVYLLDEEGMRIMQYVTTGMKCDGYVEIVEGLAEGTGVILD